MSYLNIIGSTEAIIRDIKLGKKTKEEAIEEWASEKLSLSFSEAASRFNEALGTNWFTNTVANVAHNNLVKFYNMESDWRQVCSDVISIDDFRQRQATRFSGFPYLPSKTEHAGYTELLAKDEAETYTPQETGRLFSITRRARAADTIQAFSKWSKQEGIAAARTLNRHVFYTCMGGSDDTTNHLTGPTMADGYQLFDATNHGNRQYNKGTVSAANIKEMYESYMSQQVGINSEKIRQVPRFLVVSSDLYVTALEATASILQGWGGTSSTVTSVENVFGSQGQMPLKVIQCEYLVAGTYYLVGDPNLSPTFEIGFVDGQQEPQLLQEQQGTGANFTTGEFRFRSTLDFGGCVLDFRPFCMYKSANEA